MNAEYIVVNDYTQGEKIEHVCEVVPHVGIAIFAVAFCVESIGLGYTAGLMVPTDQVNARRMSKFQTDQEGNCFDTEETTIDVVACGYNQRITWR